MKKNLQKKLMLIAAFGSLMFAGKISAQTEENQAKRVNFRYSQNPKIKPKTAAAPENQTPATDTIPKADEAPVTNNENKTEEIKTQNDEPKGDFESRSVANKTLEVARRATLTQKPTEIYKVGTGDVLFINLQNAPAKSSAYYTVLNDGTIDFPLVAEMISVGGLTTDEIEDLLKAKIKLYENPQIAVKVRDYSSHKFTVLGLVEKAGEKFLQREAVPLFVVRAEAIVQPKANRIIIKRADTTTETLEMSDRKYEDVLVFTGDIVEFAFAEPAASNVAQPQFYYIGGGVKSLGQKDFFSGMTLSQAILASGGLVRSSIRKIIIRRKTETGLLFALEFDLRAIKGGKQPDPMLRAGDTIEVGN